MNETIIKEFICGYFDSYYGFSPFMSDVNIVEKEEKEENKIFFNIEQKDYVLYFNIERIVKKNKERK